jgi:hypothetical protein
MHVARRARDPRVARVHQQRDAAVHDLCDESIALLVQRIRLDLREDVRVAAVDDLGGETGD